MGLKDLGPDDSSTSSGGRPRGKGKSNNDSDDKVEIGSEPYKKVFEEEKWEEIKKFISHEMGLQPNKVANNYKAEERYEILHEAALAVDEEKEPEDLSNYSRNRCAYCDCALGEFGVELGGETFCPSHTAGQVADLLNPDED